jgi:predicted anti-sigma-YlaC factor YlaD
MMRDHDMGCREIQQAIWSDGPETAPEEHLTDCAACRGESRRAGDLLAALHGMRTRMAVAPPALEPALLAAIERSRLQRARGLVEHRSVRWGAVGAAAAATATVGVIVARRLATRPALAAKGA